jgi:predicted nucleotidyltransferase component of viral defense system
MTERQHADIEEWINAASANPAERRRRQAAEILIATISTNPDLKNLLYLKGGMLMNLVYASPRMSGDIDFTTPAPPEGFETQITESLNRAMNPAAADLGYTRHIFKVQTTEMRPPQLDFPWPTLLMTIGYAERGTSQETLLAQGRSSLVLHVDISFNEPVYNWEEIEIRGAAIGANEGHTKETPVILAYSVYELVAEKLRAILQQRKRNRYRRQDIYDIARILSIRPFTSEQTNTVHEILVAKCQSRDIEPTRDMIDDQELYERSRERYAEMRLDRGDSPLDFEADYRSVADFYHSMPWS